MTGSSGLKCDELDQSTRDDLRTALGRFARPLVRRLDVGLTLQPTDTTDPTPFVAKSGDPTVTITGPIGEIVLYLYGRKDVAAVEIDGPRGAVETVRSAAFGI